MSISTRLINYIKGLQESADHNYMDDCPDYSCILPDDAIYLTRLSNLTSVCELIEEVVNQSGLDLATVLNKSIKPNQETIANTYPFTSEALAVIIKHFT